MRPLSVRVALDRSVPYDGTQLAPHFLRRTFGVNGDAVVAWRGPCRVSGGALVDLADREAGHRIEAAEMLHLMIELFGQGLPLAVALQRLLAAIVADRVRTALAFEGAPAVRRVGDDVYVGEGKLSVSIATVSPVSSLIHFGINIDGAGAPVPVAALGPLRIEVDRFAEDVVLAFAGEVEGIIDALGKVVPAHPGSGA